jgi:hypothetical protein
MNYVVRWTKDRDVEYDEAVKSIVSNIDDSKASAAYAELDQRIESARALLTKYGYGNDWTRNDDDEDAALHDAFVVLASCKKFSEFFEDIMTVIEDAKKNMPGDRLKLCDAILGGLKQIARVATKMNNKMNKVHDNMLKCLDTQNASKLLIDLLMNS